MTDGIRMERVVARLGRLPVGPYDLVVEPGRIVVLVGPNGAGKTTCLHLLLGLRGRDGGTVEIGGRPVDPHTPPTGTGVALLDDGHLPWLSAVDQLRLVADLRPGDPGPFDALDLVGLGEAADQPTATYSAGMLRRFGLARAFLGRPQVLVLDEPTASLDEAAGRWLGDVLREQAEAGVAVLVASHDPVLLEALGGRLVAIDHCRTT